MQAVLMYSEPQSGLMFASAKGSYEECVAHLHTIAQAYKVRSQDFYITSPFGDYIEIHRTDGTDRLVGRYHVIDLMDSAVIALP